MPDSLIIDARHRLRWHQRLMSDASTAMLWGGWLWLWRPLLSAANWLGSVGSTVGNLHPLLAGLLGASAAINVEGPLLTLAGTSGTLLLWKMLPARKPTAPAPRELQDYARHFQLPPATIEAGRRTSVCVVHHDAQGRIVRIDMRS